MARKINIPELLKKYNLPLDAHFVGFVVHLTQSDEFLSFYEDTPHAQSLMWSLLPDLAYAFPTENHAKKFVTSYGHGSVVALLFDLGHTYSLHLPD